MTKRFSILFVSLMVVLLLLIAGSAAAITDGELDGDGHPFVGLMVAQDGDGNPLRPCSGTLLVACLSC